MVLVGLTGGIGSGKSTVSARLAAHGAVVVDADAIVREVQAPGGPAFVPIVERFGDGIVAEDGSLDRAALADIVFRDPAALADLEGITHPIVSGTILERVAAEADTDHVVVLDVPLLVEGGRDDLAALLVVDCPEEIAVERLVSQRGMDRDDARRRMAAQASRDERRARADIVIDNSDGLDQLVAQVDAAWQRLVSLRDPRP